MIKFELRIIIIKQGFKHRPKESCLTLLQDVLTPILHEPFTHGKTRQMMPVIETESQRTSLLIGTDDLSMQHSENGITFHLIINKMRFQMKSLKLLPRQEESEIRHLSFKKIMNRDCNT